MARASTSAAVFLASFWSAHGALTYTNPILDRDFPDPTVFRAPDGTFYVYATGNLPAADNVQVARSHDLVTWEYLGGALTETRNKAWGDGKTFWAPDVTLQHWNGQTRFLMYYAGQSKETQSQRMCIGAAIAESPEGPFYDVGKPLVCHDGYIAIDPKRVDVKDESYLFWGSGQNGSIFVTPLEHEGWNFRASGTLKTAVALNSSWTSEYEKTIEGVWLDFKPTSETWFMYYSGSNCCGPDAHYGVSVASSKTLTGLFAKKTDLVQCHNSAILTGTDGAFQAPGHNSLIKDDAGDTWIVYHAFKGSDRGNRVLMIDRVTEKDGFPWVGNPSSTPVAAPRVGAEWSTGIIV